MRVPVGRFLCLLALAAVFISGARAQQDSETVKQFWPEVDVYVPLNEKFRSSSSPRLPKLKRPGRILKDRSELTSITSFIERQVFEPGIAMASHSVAATLSRSTGSSLNKRCANLYHSMCSSVIETAKTFVG